jgi:release factor glutamine methyltransferase
VTAVFPGQTVEAARRSLAARFKAGQTDSAELEARILVGAVLGLDLTGVISSASRLLTPEQASGLEDLARRRLAGEPVARLVGCREFWGLPLRLSAETLVPRPDTETVVELALQMVRAAPAAGRTLRIADIGTGSGAILLALLSELPEACGVGTDISVGALRTARANAADLGFASRAVFIACDHAAALSEGFDLIVSNPPYIRSAEIGGLDPEVRDHDPHRALDGGADGLDAYRALIPQAARLLTQRGALVVEVGRGQSAAVEGLMAEAGLILERPPSPDLAGVPRAVAGRNCPQKA